MFSTEVLVLVLTLVVHFEMGTRNELDCVIVLGYLHSAQKVMIQAYPVSAGSQHSQIILGSLNYAHTI